MSITNQNESNCPVCSGAETLPLCQSNGYEIVRCTTCACDFVYPMPDEKALKAYYDAESYFQGNAKGSYINYDVETEPVLPLFNDFLLSIPNVAGKKILDIGCAFGTHLTMAAEQGWEAWGVELSAYARNIALSRHGEKIHVVETINSLPKLEFDLVVILDVLEHLADPYSLFMELFLHGVIGKNTQLMITTPNARSSDALTEPSAWAYRHPPAHLVYFSAHSLGLLLTNVGGIEIDVKGIHPVAHRESYDYPDENNTLNHDFKDFAGLMCVVQGFDTFLYKLVDFFKVESIPIENSELAKLYREICEIQQDAMLKYALKEQFLHQMIEKKELELSQQEEMFQKACQLKEEEFQKLYQSKWYRLGIALKTRPMTLHNFVQIVYLSVGLTIPSTLKATVAPIASKLRQYYRKIDK
jgi:2-polyprenyl-3-methyl-5-hydroxy-6-metoxy-1,4-benzoquinol methylase